MKTTKRERERERYLKANAPTFGLEDATRRWAAYEQLVLDRTATVPTTSKPPVTSGSM